MFLQHEGCALLQGKQTPLMVFAEQVRTVFEQEFLDRIGFRVPVEGDFGGAERERDVYLSHRSGTVSEIQQRAQNTPVTKARQESLMLPWKWVPVGNNRAPQTIKAIYPALLARRAQRRHRVAEALNQFEEASVQGMRVVDVGTGEVRLAGPEHLAQWMGYPDRLIPVLQTAFPCLGIIDDVGGAPRFSSSPLAHLIMPFRLVALGGYA